MDRRFYTVSPLGEVFTGLKARDKFSGFYDLAFEILMTFRIVVGSNVYALIRAYAKFARSTSMPECFNRVAAIIFVMNK